MWTGEEERIVGPVQFCDVAHTGDHPQGELATPGYIVQL
jgi:hypothetical protein